MADSTLVLVRAHAFLVGNSGNLEFFDAMGNCVAAFTSDIWLRCSIQEDAANPRIERLV